MTFILALILTLVFAYTNMHYALSTVWKSIRGRITVSAVFSVLTAIFVGVFTAGFLVS